VNLAARIVTQPEPMMIIISENTYKLIKEDFISSERGEFKVKGFGPTALYFLEREHPRKRPLITGSA
jgi:adenylate cyclase